MKKSFAIVLLLAMVLSLAACGEAAPAATPEPTAEPTPTPETLAAEAEELFYKADYPGAFEKLDALETSGITSVQELLGTSYYFGLGVEADSEEAVAQLTKAADQGDAIAMYLLGNAYATGTGTSRDEAKAKEMYAKFIAVGEADSGENADSGRIQAYLADCYAYGKGTDKDIDKAAAAAGKAASADLTAFDMVKLAGSYVEGVFTKTDETGDTAEADAAAAEVAAEGEDGFRTKETAETQRFGKEGRQLISCGGGIVKKPENLRALHQNGVILFIDRPVDALAVGGGRPLSSSMDALRQMEAQRRPLYLAAADAVIPNNGTLDDALHAAMEALDEIFDS